MSGARRLGSDRVRVAVAYALALLAGLSASWLVARGALTVVAGDASSGWTRHPIAVAAAADIAATLVVFGCSFALNNSSVYDPYWSLAPIPIALFWVLIGAPPAAAPETGAVGDGTAGIGAAAGTRAAIVTLLVVVWGVRLTANWLRRWEGLADEDWRYREYRERGGLRYWVISLAGFHLLPTVLVFLGCVPVYFAVVGARSPGVFDALGVALASAGIWLEWVSDRELRRFVEGKGREGSLLTTGPWAWCRHPNYLGELLFWWGLALAGLAASPENPAWSLAGAIAISALFGLVSVPLMERRLAVKPGFEEYARRTPLLLPRPTRGESGD